MSTLISTPLVVETERGPSIAGTRTTVFSVMDSIKSGHPRDLIKKLFLINDDQLSAVEEYIAAHKQEIEREYAEIALRSAKRRETYEQIFKDRSPIPSNRSSEERREILRQRLAEKRKESKN